MGFISKPWDAGAVKKGMEAGDYCKLCLLDLNTSDEKIKTNCKLPVRSTPGGPYNLNAMAAAAGALAGARTPLKGVPSDKKRAAARKLVRLYRQAKRPPPPALLRVAGMKQA